MTQPNFRALCAELVDELNYHADEHSVDKLISRARTALATPPPEQKSSIDELIAGCKPLDPEMAEALTTEARWRLFGEDGSATPPPEPPTDEEIADVWLTVASEDRTLSSFGRAVLERWGK